MFFPRASQASRTSPAAHTALVAVALTATLAGCNSDASSDGSKSGAPSTVTEVATVTEEEESTAAQAAAGPSPTLAGDAPKPAANDKKDATPACGKNYGPEAAAKGIATLEPFLDRTWIARTAPGYDPCQPLSYIIVGIDGATVSSPYHIMLYHYGEYLGTATAKPQGFGPLVDQTSSHSIAVEYKFAYPDEANAEASGRTHATFTWDDAQRKVVMTGDVPNP